MCKILHGQITRGLTKINVEDIKCILNNWSFDQIYQVYHVDNNTVWYHISMCISKDVVVKV